MNSSSLIPVLAVALWGGFWASVPAAHGSVITGVSIGSVSSELVGAFDRTAIHMIDGSGFDEVTGFHTNAPDPGGGGPADTPGTMWLTTGVFAAPNDPLPAFVVFDLGGVYSLDSIKVWNYNEARAAALTGRGSNSVDISVAAIAGGTFTSLGNFTFTQATGSETTDFSQTIDLTSFAAADTVAQVRFDVLSNHGGDNQFAGLSEVRFIGTVIPEPSMLALLTFAMPVWLRRRR